MLTNFNYTKRTKGDNGHTGFLEFNIEPYAVALENGSTITFIAGLVNIVSEKVNSIFLVSEEYGFIPILNEPYFKVDVEAAEENRFVLGISDEELATFVKQMETLYKFTSVE